MTQDELLQLIDQAAAEGWTELDLSGQGLTELPPEIGKLTQLETLILGKLETYEWLNGELQVTYSSNPLQTLPASLALLGKLKTIDLSGSFLGEIPECIFSLNSLESLNADNISLAKIPEEIHYLVNLRSLSLCRNEIEFLPEELSDLTNLQDLRLDQNHIHEMPNFLFSISRLRTFHLEGNRISEIPEGIGKLQELISLRLDGNRLSEIPESVGKLKSLEYLSLSANKIKKIPGFIGELQSLKSLFLHINEIAVIPESISRLSNLTTLGLSYNKIESVPDSIGSLSQLRKLTLNENSIKKIPESIGDLYNLSTLSFYGNEIREIPESFRQLNKLELLGLFGNQINEFPDSICSLDSLTELWLSNNLIPSIPNSISRLQKLNILALGGNAIKQIPEAIGDLESLERLDLNDNFICEFPIFLERLGRLEKLDLRGNPLPIHPEMLGHDIASSCVEVRDGLGDVDDIFNYFKKLREQGFKPLNEAKLMLVGQGSVGKTSLINRLLDNRYNPNESQTDGLTVRNWGVHVNSKDVRLNVWDFGGQEIYHATHQFFLTKRSLYVLVCNCRTSEEENRIEYWLKLIQSFGGESPVIIVGNKSDEQPLDINRKALREKYPNICAILETSCQSGQGIDELRAIITEEVGKLREVYNLLPLSWFQVKEQLEALDKDFISYNEYIGICYQNNIPEEHNQTQLIELLHNLGLVLNFRNHPFLQNTNVLNPDWVTEGIYTLLSDDTLKTQGKGLLEVADLSRVLDPGRYPAERHRYLTELMQEFQLCFELPDCPCPRFLIPGLLPKEEPDDTGLKGETLEFQYHYRILPESVLSRFIVLSHEKIHNHIHWRSGVMLAYREGNDLYNIARIKADPEDKKIFIAIAGRETTRRLFLSLIRDTFTRIHRSFADLEVSEWVPVPNYPDHPPLDYQELLGLEDMGEPTVTIGKLRLRLNLRQLLDGYEPVEVRRRQRHSDKWDDREFWDDRFPRERELNPKSAIPQERTKLRQFVLELPDPQVDAVIFDLDPPKGNVPPSSSPKSERVTALFEWLESPIGLGLAALRSALAKVL